LRDLSAGAAYASMALSGEMPRWSAAVFIGAVGLALCDLRPLSGRSPLAALALGVAAVALYSSAAMAHLDLVVAAGTFAALITVSRILVRSDPRADWHVHLTSLLMIAAGASLSGEMLFAACLGTFAALSFASLGLGVVQRVGELNYPLKPLLTQLAIGAGAVLVGGALLFLVMPRFSWSVGGRHEVGAGRPVTGLADRVSLVGMGQIKTSARVIARAKLVPDPTDANLRAYWVARVYDFFDGREWRPRSTQPTRRVVQTDPPDHSLLVRQEIELLPAYGSRTLFALWPPVAFSHAAILGEGESHRAELVELEKRETRFEEFGPSYSFRAYSTASPRGAPKDGKLSEYPNYLQLPRGLDARVGALATEVAGEIGDRVRVAQTLEGYLRAHYQYTLELPGYTDDPLANFLFVTRQGHCEQFATALTMMLRTLNIPSRLVAGFYGAQRLGDRYVIRSADAHTWTEVVLPDGGILSLDATPESSRAARSNGFVEQLLTLYESLNERWRTGVLEYSFQDQKAFASWLGPLLSRSRFRIGLGSLLFLFAFALVLHLRQRASLNSELQLRSEATRLGRRALTVLAGTGIRPGAGESLEDLSKRLQANLHPVRAPLAKVARRYLEARFGTRPLRTGEGAALLRQLRRAARQPPPTGASSRRDYPPAE
jgi:transglutaminase-like putative cysteine protease